MENAADQEKLRVRRQPRQGQGQREEGAMDRGNGRSHDRAGTKYEYPASDGRLDPPKMPHLASLVLRRCKQHWRGACSRWRRL